MTEEREYSRCETCGKRLAYLGPAQPRPCPDGANDPHVCREVLDALIRARNITSAIGNDPHPETVALLDRSGFSWGDIDTEIKRRHDVDQQSRTFHLDMEEKGVIGKWIAADRDRALIVAKWAIDCIDITANGTRNLVEIEAAASDIAREIGEHAEALASQEWEFEEA